MKPAPFDYHRPTHLSEALDMLKTLGPDARPLAGGQSLIPFMNFRLARPAALVDLNHIQGLVGIIEENHSVQIKAMTRQWDVEHSAAVCQNCPIVTSALRWVGHTATKTRGTIGGSAAHADPAAEIPTVAVLLEAEMTVAGVGTERVVTASEFFIDHYTTAVGNAELLTGITFPSISPRSGWDFNEFALRAGDFALASAAVIIEADGPGRIGSARIALGGVSSTPIRVREVEGWLAGGQPGSETWQMAGQSAAQETDPADDAEIPAGYRKQLVADLVERTLAKAWARTKGDQGDD